MGQFGNQPDFATNDIKQISPSDQIDQGTFLNGSVIYIGDNSAGGDMIVIPAGVVQSTVTDLVSPGYSGSNGTGYVNAAAVATTTSGSGTGLTVDITQTSVATGSIDGLTLNVANAEFYLNGDLVTITGGDGNAVFRVIAAPGPPTGKEGVFFKGLQAGGFLPVTVDYVLATKGLPGPTQEVTTVDSLIAAR